MDTEGVYVDESISSKILIAARAELFLASVEISSTSCGMDDGVFVVGSTSRSFFLLINFFLFNDDVCNAAVCCQNVNKNISVRTNILIILTRNCFKYMRRGDISPFVGVNAVTKQMTHVRCKFLASKHYIRYLIHEKTFKNIILYQE